MIIQGLLSPHLQSFDQNKSFVKRILFPVKVKKARLVEILATMLQPVNLWNVCVQYFEYWTEVALLNALCQCFILFHLAVLSIPLSKAHYTIVAMQIQTRQPQSFTYTRETNTPRSCKNWNTPDKQAKNTIGALVCNILFWGRKCIYPTSHRLSWSSSHSIGHSSWWVCLKWHKAWGWRKQHL